MANSKRMCPYCKVYNRVDDGVLVNDRLYCSYDHATAYGIKTTPKVRAKKEKAERAHIRKRKEALESHRSKLAKAQPIFNEMRRLEEFLWFKERGLEPICISCQKPLGGDQWCAGHMKTAGEHTNTRFDRLNVWLQHNLRCNSVKSGDIDNYKLGLIARFGEEEGNRIIEHCETECKKIVRFTDDEFKEMRSKWQDRIKELKKML